MRYTDEYVDFLYSSVEKDVEWGEHKQDIYHDVEFLAEAAHIQPAAEAALTIRKGARFPRVRIGAAMLNQLGMLRY
jgi:hypothetical protein